ncbi:hypothetical protein L3Y34_019503 [Caenorhabditis briggsae]|uniref:Uncharacterized protein n=1 Tax=Caenorhabditis briggsae TaxID=6238 RepID=A0AAE9IW15_CAEBR|nr:hypothetical protein L3Y34_019503 [Caenorhabditis briggsae]
MTYLLLSLIVGVLVLENVLASDVGVTVARTDMADELKTDGLADLEFSEDLKTMNNSISRAKLISSSLDDDLDAKVHNARKDTQMEAGDVKIVDEVKSKAGRCRRYECVPNALKDTETEFLVFTVFGDDCSEANNIPVNNPECDANGHPKTMVSHPLIDFDDYFLEYVLPLVVVPYKDLCEEGRMPEVVGVELKARDAGRTETILQLREVLTVHLTEYLPVTKLTFSIVRGAANVNRSAIA